MKSLGSQILDELLVDSDLPDPVAATQPNRAPLEVIPAGLRLSDWIDGAPIGKTATYELLKALGITPAKVKLPGGSAAVSVLSEAEADRMDAAASAVASGLPISSLAGALASSPRTTATAANVAADLEPEALGPELLLARLEAGERAVRSGLPLTTTEVSWILGARPGAATVTRGRIVATRHGRNVWTLARLED